MKKLLLIILCFTIAAGFAAASDEFKQIDKLISEKDYSAARGLLVSHELSRVGTGIRNAIILLEEKTSGISWSDLTKEDKKKIISIYKESLSIIEKTFELAEALSDVETHRLYFYRGFIKALIAGVNRNMGFLVEIKKIFADIESSLELEPEFLDSVLFAAGLYQFLPGWPLSRGSNEKAISWYRYALNILSDDSSPTPADQRERSIAQNSLNLATCLAERDWNLNKRKKKQEDFHKKYSKAENIIEEIDYYEGVALILIDRLSDMEEARKLYKQAEVFYYSLQDISDKEMEEIKAMMKRVSGEIEL